MKQVLEYLNSGNIELAQVPSPKCGRNHVLINTTASLISSGTERMLVDFGKANLIDKARQQPDKVKDVLEKVRTDGVAATFDAIRSKLDQPLALGYCNVGRVADIGASVTSFSPGDRVVSNGRHAEVVAVPKNLCARVPDDVSDEAAAFTVVAAIGLQGIRLANPTLGECIAVTGLGLIGLLTVQLLRAQGCRVLGIDIDPTRLALAREFGAEVVDAAAGNVEAAAAAISRGRGMDAVIVTASTKSNEPISQAARMCRKRGRIVLVGVVGLELSRGDFYEKELTFQVSCSYGPGRYDPAYEEGGVDYPIGFVRWTEQRNFEAVLDLMANGILNVEPLITHRFPIDNSQAAFGLLASDTPSLGIILQYQPRMEPQRLTVRKLRLTDGFKAGTATVAFLGAGNYAGRVLIPAFKTAGAQLHTLVSAGGISAVHFGRKYGFAEAATESASVFDNPAIDTIVVATRHDAHADQVLAALRAGKHVFCEKPLCLAIEELCEIEAEARARPGQILMVGFNRRFAPQVKKMKSLLSSVSGPKNFIMTVNAGDIPPEHWTQDHNVGGGRIIGEACHFIDLLRYLVGSPIMEFEAVALGRRSGLSVRDDKVSITMSFEDGSVGNVHYLANGHRAFPKERLEVFAAGRILQLDNFRKLRGWGWKGFAGLNLWQQDKGQRACAKTFVEAIKQGGPPPIPQDEIFEVSRVTINVAQSVNA